MVDTTPITLDLMREIATAHAKQDERAYNAAWETLICALTRGASLHPCNLPQHLYIYRRAPFQVWHLQDRLDSPSRVMEVVRYDAKGSRLETYTPSNSPTSA